MSASFYTAEVNAFRPGEITGESTYAWATDAWAAPPQLPFEEAATAVFRASDSGYRTEYAAGTVTVYPPVLERTVDLDRLITLAPSATAASVSVGSIRLINADGRWDQVAGAFSPDARPVRLAYGQRIFDATRRLWLDPPSSALVDLFRGLAQGWRLSETALEIPLRDASYWLQQQYQRNVYGGTGGLDGDASLAGQTKPRARGGTSATPIQQAAPVLVDAVNRIYQINDGPGSVTAVYENGLPFSFSGEVGDLYSGTTPAGTFRVDNARGLFQLGSPAVGTVTADVIGFFPAAGGQPAARDIARYILTEDMGLAADLVDVASFAALPAGRVSGWYWPSGDQSTGAQAVSVFLRGLGAKLVPPRGGRLRALPLRAVAAGAAIKAALGPAQIRDLRPNVLPAPLDPPAFRWRVGYARNHRLLGSAASEALTDERRRALRQEWQYGVALSPSAQAAYATPSDPEPLVTALMSKTDAEALATATADLWSLKRRLYDATLPVEVGMKLDLGDIVRLSYPFGNLHDGQVGQIVGDQMRGNDGTIVVQVLV